MLNVHVYKTLREFYYSFQNESNKIYANYFWASSFWEAS